MKRNRTEGKPVVYLDETWANAHDGKKKAWVETDTTTKGTTGGVQGYIEMYFVLYVFQCFKVNHPEKEKDLLYSMQVAKKDGLPVNNLCCEYE